MSLGLIAWDAPSSAPLARYSASPQARALSADQFTEGKKQLTWADLPERSRASDNGVGELVMEFVRDFERFVRMINGAPHQVRAGVRAYTDRIVVVHAIRPLSKGADGKMRPAGPWQHWKADTYRATTRPVRTRGVVATGIGDNPVDPSNAGGQIPKDQESGARTLPYLPPPVQSTVLHAVKQPHTWFAGATMTVDTNTGPESQWLSMVRLSDTAGVVIKAERHAPTNAKRPGSFQDGDAAFQKLPWQITQVTYSFDPSRQIEGTR